MRFPVLLIAVLGTFGAARPHAPPPAPVGVHVHHGPDTERLWPPAPPHAKEHQRSQWFRSSKLSPKCQEVCYPDVEADLDRTAWPLTKNNLVTFILAAVIVMVAAGAGIGGGGILVPMFILVSGFHARYAIPLSNVTILGSAVSNILWNSQRRHPTADRYLVDWGVVNVMEPMTMAGAIFGALLNKLLPQWITLVLLAVVLGCVSVKTYFSGLQRWEKENETASDDGFPAAIKGADAFEGVSEETSLMGNRTAIPLETYQATQLSDKLEICRPSDFVEERVSSGLRDPLDADFERHVLHVENKEEIEHILEAERHVPWDMMAALFLTFVGCTGLDMARGGNGFNPFGVVCGTEEYWILTFAYIPFTAAIATCVGYKLVSEVARKEEIGYPFQEGDVRWTSWTTFIYSVVCR